MEGSEHNHHNNVVAQNSITIDFIDDFSNQSISQIELISNKK